MVTPFQKRALRIFRQKAVGWERPVNHPGIGDPTFDALVEHGYLEERLEGTGRWLRITEKGDLALDQNEW